MYNKQFFYHCVLCAQANPEDNFTLILAVFLEIFHIILREIIALASANNKVAGVAVLVCFVVLGLLPMVITIVVCIIQMIHAKNKNKGGDSNTKLAHHSPVISFFTTIYNSFRSQDENHQDKQIPIHSQAAFFACVFNSAVLGLYFYGDNLGHILQMYGQDLGCDESCLELNHTIANICLGGAAFLLHIFPQIMKQLVKMCGWEYKPYGWYKDLSIFKFLVKIDSIYTTLVIFVQTSDYCSPSEVSLSLILITTCSVLGIKAIIGKGIHRVRKGNGKTRLTKKHFTFAISLLVLVLPLYLFTDNAQPLDCGFECDLLENNTTTMIQDVTTVVGGSCKMNANSITRLILAILTGVLLITVLALGIYGYYGEQKPGEAAQDTPQLELSSVITASGLDPKELSGILHETSTEEDTKEHVAGHELQKEGDSKEGDPVTLP